MHLHFLLEAVHETRASSTSEKLCMVQCGHHNQVAVHGGRASTTSEKQCMEPERAPQPSSSAWSQSEHHNRVAVHGARASTTNEQQCMEPERAPQARARLQDALIQVVIDATAELSHTHVRWACACVHDTDSPTATCTCHFGPSCTSSGNVTTSVYSIRATLYTLILV